MARCQSRCQCQEGLCFFLYFRFEQIVPPNVSFMKSIKPLVVLAKDTVG